MSTKKDISYPPGGFLMWLIITIELLTIFLFLIFYIIDQKNNLTIFNTSILSNNINIALVNTLILMLSGYFITKVETEGKNLNLKYLFSSFLLGTLFLFIKLFEYKLKISQGIFFDTNSFYTYYWFLTLFHLFHVLIALGLFIYIMFRYRNRVVESNETIKSIEVFWHLCDLIWIIILPFLYGFDNSVYAIYLSLSLFVIKSYIIFKYFIKIKNSHIFWQGLSGLFVFMFFILILINQNLK